MEKKLSELIEKSKVEYGKKCVDDNLIYCYGDYMAKSLLANGVIVLPCKVGDWIWYVYRNEINKAKVEEINYDSSKHGYYSYNFSIYAWDFKNKRQVAYHPINETQRNKSNINGVEGMDWGEEVYVFLTREEAKKALKGGAE